MKSERLNNVILLVSAIVFILQSIGYFAPAWFIKEVVVSSSRNGMVADRRHFKLPYWEELFENDEPDTGSMPVPSQEDSSWFDNMHGRVDGDNMWPNSDIQRPIGGDGARRSDTSVPFSNEDGSAHTIKRRSVERPRPPQATSSGGDSNTSVDINKGNKGVEKGKGKVVPNAEQKTNKPELVSVTEATTQIVGWEDTTEQTDKEKESPVKDKEKSTKKPNKPALIPETNPDSIETGDDTSEKADGVGSKEKVDITSQEATRKPVFTFEPIDGPPLLDSEHPSRPAFPNDVARSTIEEAASNRETVATKRKYVLYLSAGMWYSRACVYPARNSAGANNVADDMEWCALYIRTDDRTLEMKNNMFEFRIETTISLASSLLSLVLASTGCCSNRRYGTRAIASLSTMFISGGLMAVPVVHMILGHIELHGHVMGQDRKHVRVHHLFEHYSVIVCGAASLLAIMTTVVIAIMKCRSNSSPSNWYDVEHDNTTKTELPIKWVHNSKTTVPAVTMIKEITRDETESGYCEMPEDDVAASNTDSVSVTDQKDVNDFGQLELVPSELESFEM